MSETRYTKDHEWVRLEGTTATVGITDHAQQALGDVVFLELPEVGRAVEAGVPIAVVESVKAASDVYGPIGGTVTEVNTALVEDPSKINAAAESAAWFFRMTVPDRSSFDQIMDEAEYKAFVETL